MGKVSNNSERTPISLRRRVLSLPTLLSFGLAAALLVFLLTRFDIDLSATWGNIKGSDPFYYLLAVLIHYTTFIFRGARWRMLLKNALRSPDQSRTTSLDGLPHESATEDTKQEEHTRMPSVWYCAGLILLSWFANSVTWFRLGDAYRAYVYSEDTRGSFSRTAGTVLAERVFDVAMVFILLLAAALALYFGRGQAPSWLFLGLALVLVAGMAAILAGMTIFRTRFVSLLPGRLQQAYQRFHHGTVASFRQVPLVFFLSLMGWMSEVGRLFFVVKALGLSLDFSVVLFATLGNALLTLVPVTPGGLGIVEPGITGLLRVLTGLSRGVALSVTLVDRSISYLSVIVFGAIFFLGREVAKRRRPVGQGTFAGPR